MFGSNFMENFGIPPLDANGGLFGPNAPLGGAQTGSQSSPLGAGIGAQPPQPAAVPAAQPPVAGAPGIQPPGQVPQPQPGNSAAALAPGPLAAGAKSEFNKGM